MAPPVILVEAQPRNAADGVAVPLRLAGLGGLYPYFYGEQHYRAGIAGLPRTIASLDFDGEQLGGGGVPQAMELHWSPAGRAMLAEVAALYWTDAPITVRIGPEGEALPPIATTGLVVDAPVEGGSLRITLSDAAADLKKALLTDRFAGTGGIEGPVELEGIIKSRAWGRCFNVPGQLIDRGANIWCFGDPRRAWQRFVQVRDRGVALTVVQLLTWQGTAEATFAALMGAAVADGGVIVCPSIACVKLWTQATGDLKADIEGETAGGYVETAPEIVARLVAVRSTIPIAPGALAEAAAWRPAPTGWRIDNDTTTSADAISELLGDVSLSWLLIGGQLRFRRWEWTASTRVARSHRVTRRSTVKPVGTRKLGYRRNWSPMARGDLAAIVLVTDLAYEDGTTFEELKPAQAGADVTGQNTAKDTAAVAGRPAGQVTAEIDTNKAAVEQATRDITAARTSLASDIVAVRGETAKVRSDLSTSLSDVQGQAASARSEAASVASSLSAEVDRAKGAEGTLTTKVETAQGRADAAYSAVTDETVNRAAADSAIAGRVSTTEAQLRGDQDSMIAARVRDEAATRASQDSAIAGRVATVEANYSGATGGNLAGRGTFKDGSVAGWTDWPGAVVGTDSNMPANPGYPAFARFFVRDTLGQIIRRDWNGRRLRVRALLSAVETTHTIGAGFFVSNSNGQITDFVINRIPAGQGWSWVDYEWTCPPGAAEIRPWLQIDAYDNFGAGIVSYYELTDVTDLRYADAKVADEAAARSSQDSAIAGRVSTTEAQLRGDQDSTIAARVRDEATTRASQDSAIAARASVLEARGGASGGNLIPQTQFYDFSGWEGQQPAGGQYDSRAINAPSADWYPPGENVFSIHQIGASDNDNAAYWDYYTINVMAVEAGQFYQYYAYIAAHRCPVETYVAWYDVNNNIITYHGTGPARAKVGGRQLSNWSLIGQLSVPAPAGAATARFYMRKRNTDAGQGDSWAWFFRPYFGRAREGQAEWNAFTHGSGTPLAGTVNVRVADEAIVRASQDSAIAGRVSTTEAQLRGDQDSTIAARIRDEAATRASQDGAIAGRVSTTEAQLRGDQDSTIAARIRDEAATRASQDGAIAGRVSTTEAQLRGDQDSVIATRVRDEAAARASQDSAIAGRVATTEAQIARAPEVFRVQARGNGAYNAPFGGSKVITPDGSVSWTGGRSYLVVVFDPGSNRVGYANTFDVYGDDNARANMAALLQGIGLGQTVVIATNDEPANGRFGRGLDTAMASIGAGEAYFSPTFKLHAAYILVGRAGAGRGGGVEYYKGDVDTDPSAFLDVNIPMLGGRPALGSNSGVAQVRAALTDEASVRAAADSAISSRVSTTEARAGDLESRTSIIQTSVTDTTKKLEDARLEFSAITSGGRAALVIRSNKNSGAGIDLTGDLRVSGDVVVDGTFKPTKFDRSAMSREGQSSWSGSITPSAGQSATVPWSLGLGTISPLGRFIWEFAASVSTNAGQQQTSNYNGKPLYTNYRDDGGLFVRCTDAQGNVYDARAQGSSMVIASTAFDATFVAFINNGGFDTGIVNDGDYYRRTVSATYTVTAIRLKATWVAI